MHISALDTALFRFINEGLHFGALDPVMTFITARSYLVALPVLLLMLARDRRKTLLALALAVVAVLLADWTGAVLKGLIGRPRPCNALEAVNLLVGCSRSFSMPSNHAANTFAFAATFYFLTRDRLRYGLLAIAAAVGFSRPYVGVHYPSDVLAGAVLGTAIALLIVLSYRWATRSAAEKPYATGLAVLLAAVSLFRVYFVTRGYLGLSPDEAHYWEWSRRLDLSFYSKGPLIAYLIAAGTSIFGSNEFGVRVLAMALSVLSSLVLYALGRDLYDEKVGALAAMLFQAVPLFNTYGVLMTIDAPFVFFWLLSLLLFYRAATRGSLSYWALLGVSVGMGLLAKYTMALFYPCAALFLLASAGRRKALLSPGPYAALVLSLALFSPVIIWNAGHGWVSVKHTAFSHLNVDEGLMVSAGSVLNFLGGQLGVVGPLLLPLMLYALLKRQRTERWSFLFWFSVPVLLLFLAKSLQGKVQANWAMSGYLTGLVAFSAVYLAGFASAGWARKALVAAAVAMSVFISAVAHFPSLVGLSPGLDPSTRLKGWKPLAAEVGALQAGLDGPSFIFSDSYQVSSELAFYVRGHPVTYCVNLGRRMNQYDLWPGPGRLIGYDAIFVTIGDGRLPGRLRQAFDSYEKRAFVAYDRRGRKLRDYSIFVLRGFRGMERESPETF
jgi:membrane-associated phospholipid phosphatase